MNAHAILSNLLLVLFFLHFSPTKSARTILTTGSNGFSLELIHRDSPRSPLYDPSSTSAQQAEQAALRSISRSGYFASGLTATPSSSTNGVAQSPVRPGNGDYLVTFSLGTPSHSYWAILDTGSDLTWTQCRPCDSCTGRILSMFNPLASSTYMNQGCASSACTALPAREKHCNANSVCGFRHTYGDGSSAGGDLASETIWFDAGVKFSNVAFGCVHDERGNLALHQVAGIVGLGGGSLSLISQLGNSVGNKFAYCLVPPTAGSATGKLKFGAAAVFPGSGALKRTPLSRQGEQGTYYVLYLVDISVGSKRLDIESKSSPSIVPMRGSGKGIGPMVIDSGSTLTMLTRAVYAAVEKEVSSAVSFEFAPPPAGYELCYRANPSNLRNFPAITFHFEGADWTVPAWSAFVRAGEGVMCLAIVPTDGVNVFGNVAQQNVYVEYDLGKGMLSFAPTDCTKA
ncbi:Aspartic proteinase [Nymphaea thermarum]|nr:Aspartic proteinase [Nymphaea thermarum]